MRRGPICLASTKTGKKCRRHVTKSGQRCPTHKTVSIDYFYGFYPYPEVWIGTKPEKELKEILGGDEDQKENALKIIRAAEKIYKSRNFELRICKDGLILFRMNSIDRKVLSFRDKDSRSLAGGWGDLYEAWNEYLLHLNLLSFLLASACAHRPAGPYYVFECREIQKFDVARITFENNEPKRSLWYGPELKSSAFRRGKIHSASDYEYDRPNIPVDIFDELFTQYEAVISTPNATTLLQPIMKAYFEYMAKNNHLALTLSWTAIEMHLFNKYRSYLETINQTFPDGRKRINSARKKILSGTNVPVARVIEYLEIHSEISLEQYEEFNRIRSIRNKIIHGGHSCSSGEAKEALKLALDAFNQETAILLTVTNHGPGTTGL